jgi:hypothetical protein
MWVQPKTTGTASAGKTLLPTRSPAEAAFFSPASSLGVTIFIAVLQLKRIYEAPQRQVRG